MGARTRFSPKTVILPRQEHYFWGVFVSIFKCYQVSLYEKCQKPTRKHMKSKTDAPWRGLNTIKATQNLRILDKTRTKSPFVGAALLSIKYEENCDFRCFINTHADLPEKTRTKIRSRHNLSSDHQKHSIKYMENAHTTAATSKKM